MPIHRPGTLNKEPVFLTPCAFNTLIIDERKLETAEQSSLEGELGEKNILVKDYTKRCKAKQSARARDLFSSEYFH